MISMTSSDHLCALISVMLYLPHQNSGKNVHTSIF